MALTAVVLAAGRGERLAAGRPKGFVELAGRTLVERSIAVLASHPAVDAVLPVVGAADRERFAALGLVDAKLLPAVTGGRERQDSVRAAVAVLPSGTDWVAVHDAARCLVTRAAIGRVIERAFECGAALLAVPASDTIKRVRDGIVAETPSREECWAAQTPQVFRADWLREALDKAAADGVVGTDDAELVARLGVEVAVVAGDPENLKITRPSDLEAARAVLVARGGD